jgi:two-component system CheB/CheR fusion protein
MTKRPSRQVRKGEGDEARQEPPVEPFSVVGIGASAGGLVAFIALVENLPPQAPLALVLVQHLSTEHESILPELLARKSSWPVLEAREGLRLQPHHIYVGPPGLRVTLDQGTLRLGSTRASKGQPQLIDELLGSLALEWSSQAVGVVLSGTGVDGTQGLRAIKDAGGTTFAQEPDSAHFGAMPRSAISAGCVDHVLRPEDIAIALAGLTPAQSLVAPSEPPEAPELARVFRLLRTAIGVDFTLYKPTTIHRRLARRMAHYRMERLADYVRYLEEHPEELTTLQEDLLIHVTSFFRDPEMFQALQQTVFPALLKDRPPGEPLRLWVPGCATGEEVYSLLICLLEYLGDDAASLSLQAFATDVSESALAQARKGFYPEAITTDVSPERLQRFFSKADGGYQVLRSLRDLCVFARHNVVSDPPFSRMDLISCRNVLIYLGPALQRRVLPTLHYALKDSGYLVLGSSETIGPAAELFSLEDKRHRIYRRKSTAYRPRLLFTTPEPSTLRGEGPPHQAERAPPPLDPQKEADRLVLAQYGPPGVIINDAMEILHFRGHTGPYLEPLPGVASLNLLKMARDGLAAELRAAIRQAQRGAGRVRKERVPITAIDNPRRVNLEVRPLRASSSGRERYYLVLFEEAEALPPPPKQRQARAGKADARATQEEVVRLRDELAMTREHLQTLLEEQESTYEELRSANEETQSSNEELQSTNEELETAKEELQSSNEELNTLNEELQNRNSELSQLNSDLNNLLGSTHIATVMLGSDLRIRRFTPMAEAVLGLTAADLGRFFRDLQLSLPLPDLERRALEVTETLSVFECEVRDREGHWFLLRLRPYKTLDNKIDGVVMALLDIDRLKHSLDEAQRAREYAEALVETMHEPFLVLDASLRVIAANRPFYESFHVVEEQTLWRPLYELGNGQWNIPTLRLLLEEILPRDTQLRDFLVEHHFERLGMRRMRLNARRVMGKEPGTQRILLFLRDVTRGT